jgi:putative membrane protein
MAIGLLAMARAIEPLLINYPKITFSFFGGLVLASVYYPLRLAGKVSAATSLWVIPGIFVGLLLTGELFEWRLEVITPVAAAIAISALVLPGVSGSFLLLLLGSYEKTISALNNLDLAYLASFAFGAIIGLVTIVFLVRSFLTNFPKPTYLFMAGLMLGTLPGLFPDLGDGIEERMPVILSAVLGLALVSIFILVERKMNFSSSTDNTQ